MKEVVVNWGGNLRHALGQSAMGAWEIARASLNAYASLLVKAAGEPKYVTVRVHGAAANQWKIRVWAAQHELTSEEIGRLDQVLREVNPSELASELASELDAILAAREIAKMTLPTAKDMLMIRRAIESGIIPAKNPPID